MGPSTEDVIAARTITVAMVVLLGSLLGMPGAAAAGSLEVTVLAVGQSDALLFRGPCGDTGLIDAGRGDDSYVLNHLDATYGRSSLKWMSVSHYDADHVGDIADVGQASGVAVSAVYDRGGDRNTKDTVTYRDYYDWVTGAGVRSPVDIGDTFSLCSGQVLFTVKSVGTDGTAVDGVAVSEENDRGVCVHVEFGDFDMASCGDVNGTDDGSRTDVESAIADNYGDVEFVKVNHHGSKFSSNATYVGTLSAEVAAISVGSNSFGHPDPGVIGRWEQSGATVLQTLNSDGSVHDGDIKVTTGGSGSFTVTSNSGTSTLPMDEDQSDPLPEDGQPSAVIRDATWYLRTSPGGGAADVSFRYGRTSDLPFFGDWNGDGTATPGVYRDGHWYLRNSNSAGGADIQFFYGGHAGDFPVVGDWNGDGVDTVGIIRSGEWHLVNSHRSGAADLTFTYGRIGPRGDDFPLVGDWNGNGTDTPGIVREGEWHLRNTNSAGPGEIVFTYGRVGPRGDDVPIIGDWDNSGVDTVGIVRGADWYLRSQNAGGSADWVYRYGHPDDWKSVVGGFADTTQAARR